MKLAYDMKKAWIGVLILVASINLESIAQEPANPKMQSGRNGKASSESPNPAYNSGVGKKGSGTYSPKMKNGVSRSGDSNLETGGGKTADVGMPAPKQTATKQSASSVNNPSVTNKKGNASENDPSVVGSSPGAKPSDRSKVGGQTSLNNTNQATGKKSTQGSGISPGGDPAKYNTSKGSTTGPSAGSSRTNKSGTSPKGSTGNQ